MARIRTIKPDAFLSESLSHVPRGTRWTFAGLWTYADDKGRARDDARLIKAALYPLDETVTLDDVAHDLRILAGIGGICRYVVEGRNYLHMPNWEHQKINRPTPAKSPPCPVHEGGESGYVLESEPSVMDHGGLSEDSRGERKGREMDREGEGNLLSDKSDDGFAPTSDRFDEFWDTYSHKVGRAKAEKAWRAALKKPGVTADLLIASAAAYVTWQMSEGKHPEFTKHPTTWLHGEHWTDERPSRPAPMSRTQQHLRVAEKLQAEQDAQMIPFPQIGGGER